MEGLRNERKNAVHAIFPCLRFFENRPILPFDASITSRENPAAEGRDHYEV